MERRTYQFSELDTQEEVCKEFNTLRDEICGEFDAINKKLDDLAKSKTKSKTKE